MSRTSVRRWGPLGLVLLVSALVGAWMTQEATTPQHDDVIALLSASATLDDWAQLVEEPRTPRRSGDVLALTAPVTPDPAAIHANLANHDLHPPLYYLVLSVWRWVVGGSLAAALALNVVLTLVTVALVARLGQRVSLARGQQLLAAAVVGVAPATLATAQEARAYPLAALLSVALVLATLRFVDERRRVHGAVVAVVTAALLLSHYSGVWIVAGIAVASASRRRWQVVVPLVGGGLLALAAFPAVLAQLEQQAGQQVTALADVDVVARLRHAVAAAASLAWIDRPAPLLVLAAVAVGGAVAWRLRRDDDLGWLARAVFVATVGIVGFYLAGRAPEYAMGPKYLAFVWPLIVPVLASYAPAGWRATVGGVVVALALVAWSWPALTARLPDAPTATMQAADLVVVDTPARGVVPVTLWHVADDATVLLGAPGEVQEGGLERLDGCRLVYVHSLRDATPATRDAVIGALDGAGWQVSPLEPPPARGTTAFTATRPC